MAEIRPPQRVLVTGGAGFVGHRVVSELLAKGYQVVVADDLSNPQSVVEPGYDFLHADMGDPAAADDAFRGVDACIAMASRRGAIGYVHRHPAEILVGNNRIYSATFGAANRAGVRRLVFVSSSMIYDSVESFPVKESDAETMAAPRSVFGFSKLIGERYCETFESEGGPPYAIVRPSNVYGPEERPGRVAGDAHVIPDLFRKIMSGQRPVEIFGDGRQSRSFVHVDDVARGMVMALESERAVNETFNLAGVDEISIIDLARKMWALCGMTGALEMVTAPGFPQDVRRQSLAIGKARRLLGWEPQMPFDDGLAQVVAWLLREYPRAA